MANAVQRICVLLLLNRTPQESLNRGEKKKGPETRESEGKLGLYEKKERAGVVETWGSYQV